MTGFSNKYVSKSPTGDGTSSGYSFYFRSSNPYVMFGVKDGTNSASSYAWNTPNYRDGTWHNIIVTFKYGATVSMYIDGGGSYSQHRTAATVTNSISNSASFQIGKGVKWPLDV